MTRARRKQATGLALVVGSMGSPPACHRETPAVALQADAADVGTAAPPVGLSPSPRPDASQWFAQGPGREAILRASAAIMRERAPSSMRRQFAGSPPSEAEPRRGRAAARRAEDPAAGDRAGAVRWLELARSHGAGGDRAATAVAAGAGDA
ncbi:MAG: hypothetical protein U0168_15360 [Nannocystaceae bacterium]